jgi:phosphatidylglycerol:prolipoprotein diacylglycerol transferase
VIPYLELPPISLGPVQIQPFGVFVCVAIVVGAILAGRRARMVGLPTGTVGNTVRVTAIFGIFGSHLVHVIAYHPQDLAHDPWILLKFWAGMSSLGGFFSAAIAGFIYLRWKRIPFLPYADTILFGFVPAWMIARVGCAVVHDHPGRYSRFPLAVRFPDGPRHDLGFYEVLLSLIWIPLVYWLGRKNKIDDPPPGTILSVMTIAYCVPRFFLDFLRATDLPRHDVRYLGFTPAQYGCFLLTVMSIVFLIRLRGRVHHPIPE